MPPAFTFHTTWVSSMVVSAAVTGSFRVGGRVRGAGLLFGEGQGSQVGDFTAPFLGAHHDAMVFDLMVDG